MKRPYMILAGCLGIGFLGGVVGMVLWFSWHGTSAGSRLTALAGNDPVAKAAEDYAVAAYSQDCDAMRRLLLPREDHLLEGHLPEPCSEKQARSLDDANGVPPSLIREHITASIESRKELAAGTLCDIVLHVPDESRLLRRIQATAGSDPASENLVKAYRTALANPPFPTKAEHFSVVVTQDQGKPWVVHPDKLAEAEAARQVIAAKQLEIRDLRYLRGHVRGTFKNKAAVALTSIGGICFFLDESGSRIGQAHFQEPKLKPSVLHPFSWKVDAPSDTKGVEMVVTTVKLEKTLRKGTMLRSVAREAEQYPADSIQVTLRSIKSGWRKQLIGKVKNSGDRTVDTVLLQLSFYGAASALVADWTFVPEELSAAIHGPADVPFSAVPSEDRLLRPGYVRDFVLDLGDGPEGFDGKVEHVTGKAILVRFAQETSPTAS